MVYVPSNLTRMGLSQVVNMLLTSDIHKHTPFDFLLDGVLVRDTLEAHMASHSISAEDVVSLEYIPVLLPPKLAQSTTVGPEWVTSLAYVASVGVVYGDFGGALGHVDQYLEKVNTV